jgi:hypothetical protein
MSEQNPARWRRLHQVVLVTSIVPLSWLGLMAVHEFGHVLGAWLTGGTVVKVVLYPLTISRTDVAPNPKPLIVAWSGPLVGVLVPLAVLGLAWILRLWGAYLLRFFTGACMIANGCYLGIGSFGGIGDAGDLLRHGAAAWQLWLFGAVTVPLGLLCWHGLGPHFGFGKAEGKVEPAAAYVTMAVLGLGVALSFLWGGE